MMIGICQNGIVPEIAEESKSKVINQISSQAKCFKSRRNDCERLRQGVLFAGEALPEFLALPIAVFLKRKESKEYFNKQLIIGNHSVSFSAAAADHPLSSSVCTDFVSGNCLSAFSADPSTGHPQMYYV
ncbi:hypothetical protein E3N88_13066 [Mikania micrantha]|uniref:Uncharacterized protein n=1 Tax=Mikania micrantha TaxID=192012 RepID=A0A5N6P9T9_9ASTR|nr:hypothetical protein E3N88_13066 [Mikania micrantha]